MPIHTVAPDSPEFIRVTERTQGGFGVSGDGVIQKGCVGKVVSRGRGSGRVQPELVIANIVGHGERIFNVGNTELITEKEYFIGALSGRKT